ncbi:type II secretion system F family protein [bacterium]|nr:MAG: type II secretion system F family protein [bacterium]
MQTWVYEARDRAGKVVQGAHQAPDRRSALEFLREQGLFLTRLEAKKGGSAPPSRSTAAKPVTAKSTAPSSVAARPAEVPTVSPGMNAANAVSPIHDNPGFEKKPVTTVPPPQTRLHSSSVSPNFQHPGMATTPIPPQPLLQASSKDLSIFFRQTGSMLHAGTTIGAAMNSMSDNAPSKGLRQAAAQIERRAMSGEPMSESMRAFPGLFTPLQIGLVNAGERGGFLDSSFERLAVYSERDYDLQQMIKKETWYPKLLILASILIPGAVPLVLAIVKGGENPLVAWLKSVGPPLIILGLAYAIFRAANYASPYAAHQNALKLTLDRLKLYVPVMGKVVRGLATAKFCRALGALTAAGVVPGESMRLASSACGNAAIALSTMESIPKLENGEPLTKTLAETGHFPKMVIQMLKVGEDSGNIDGQLNKAADFLESDSEVAIKQAIQVMGILVFLLIAIRIGMQVGAFWTGYFDSVFKMAEG